MMWERAWTQKTLQNVEHPREGVGRVHRLGGVREGEYTPWSVLFPLGSVLRAISFPEVEGHESGRDSKDLGSGAPQLPVVSNCYICLLSLWVSRQ